MVPPKSGHVHCEKTVFQTLFFGVPSQGYGVGAICGGDRLGVRQTRRIPFDHVLQPFISAYHILSLKTFGELQLVFFSSSSSSMQHIQDAKDPPLPTALEKKI